MSDIIEIIKKIDTLHNISNKINVRRSQILSADKCL